MQCQSLAAIGARLAVCAVVLAPGQIAAQSSVELEQEVREALRRDRDLRRVGVAVTGSEVTLTGELETFWAKSEAIRRTLEHRPALLDTAVLDDEERAMLDEIRKERGTP